jgi:uncharacterized protein
MHIWSMPIAGSVFVDTSALYALLVGSETHHTAVTRSFIQALERGRMLLTTNYVVVEATALLQHRIGLDAVRDLEARLLPVISVRWVDSDTHRRAIDRLFRIDKRRVSLVDAVSFVCMEAEGVSDALTLDADFEHEGFRLLP